MRDDVVPYLIHMSTLFRNLGDVLELPEATAIGNDILSLSLLSEDELFHKLAADIRGEELTAVGAKVPVPFRKNYDYGELWPKILDDYRDGKIRTIVDFVRKKKSVEKGKRRKKASYVAPIDSYCGSKRNVAYWSELLKHSPSKAVRDFIKYVQEVSCGVGEGR